MMTGGDSASPADPPTNPTRERHAMDYEFTTPEPISEQEAHVGGATSQELVTTLRFAQSTEHPV